VSRNFFGLPVYASTMSFEILTEEDVDTFPTDTDSLHVRFLFRNGSDDGAALEPFPLFGRSELSLPWSDFVSEMQTRAISTAGEWCGVCGLIEEFCAAYNTASANAGSGSSGMSTPVAGVIGAVVALGAVAVCGLFAFFLLRRRDAGRRAARRNDMTEKSSIASGSTIA
jgi:hypothetical protein